MMTDETNATVTVIARCQTRPGAGDEAARALKWRHRRFHPRIAELAGKALEMPDRPWNQLMVSARASLKPADRPDAVAGEHRELLAAITHGDAALACRVAAGHTSATAGNWNATTSEERDDAEKP